MFFSPCVFRGLGDGRSPRRGGYPRQARSARRDREYTCYDISRDADSTAIFKGKKQEYHSLNHAFRMINPTWPFFRRMICRKAAAFGRGRGRFCVDSGMQRVSR